MLFLQLLVNGIVLGCNYALMAIGFGLIYSTTRVFHFAHGAIYTASAYLFYLLFDESGWPFVAAMCAAVILAAASGVLTDEFLYRVISRRRGSLLTQMVGSLGLYTIIVNVIVIMYGSGAVVPHSDANRVIFRPLSVTWLQVVTVVTAVALLALLTLLLKKTRLGRLVRAVRDNPDLVSALGYNPRLVRWVVFALGSGLAAVAAVLLGVDRGLNPHVGMNALLVAAIAVFLGGVDRFRGAPVGALVIGILQGVVVWQFSARWVDAVAFVVLITFLIYRIRGTYLMPRRAEAKA